MSFRKSFAKKANSYQRGMKNYMNEADIFFVVPPLIIGAALGLGGAFSTDVLKPLDSQPHMGQEIAVQQHQAALTQLKEQQNALKEAQSAAHFTPQSLGTIIELSAEDQSNKGNAIEIQNQYSSMLDAFVTSVHVDKRLNETDAKNLMETFETAHGAIEDVTSFHTALDYNDLDEARAWVDERAADEDEQFLARSINSRASEVNEKSAFLAVGGTAALLPFLLSLLLATMGGPLKRWERDVPKPKNTGKFNH